MASVAYRQAANQTPTYHNQLQTHCTPQSPLVDQTYSITYAWFIGWLVHWLVGSLVGWFIGWLVHWLVGSLVGSLVGLSVVVRYHVYRTD
jgi:hypothetical protein